MGERTLPLTKKVQGKIQQSAETSPDGSFFPKWANSSVSSPWK